MHRPLWNAILGVALCAAIATGGHAAGPEPATLVLRGGKVHTMDAQRTVARAIAIRDARIVAVGDDAAVARYIGSHTRVIALNGRMVLPGFIDAHIHSVVGSLWMTKCDAADVPLDVAGLQAKVRNCLATDPQGGAGDWFEVVQVNPAGLVLARADLDRIMADRPLAMRGTDGHTVWLNTPGLQRANIDASTPDPVGGKIARDARGQPTGFLTDAAAHLLAAVIPMPPLARRVAAARSALAEENALGITSIQDAMATPEVLDTYAALERAGALTVRVRAVLGSRVTDDPAEFRRLASLRDQYATGHPRLRADSVKILADGVPEYPTQTAAMLKPYLDGHGHPTSNYGGRFYAQDLLNRYIARLDKEGYTVHVHAIGDATVRAALDAFQYAREQNGAADHRHEMAHLQFVDPADFPRFAALGVVANMQLYWAIPEPYTIEALQPYVDAQTFRYMYPAASLQRAGAMLVGGSDWPVTTENPLLAIEAGVLRTNRATGKVLNAEERVSVATMLAAYTINAAWAMKQDATTGSLEPGKAADLVVLDRDITAIPPEQIHTATVQLTLLDGRPVFEANAK